MKFRDFTTEDNDLYKLSHQFYWNNSKYRIGPWDKCDKSNEGLIALKSSECRGVDIREVVIEADAESKQIRISALVWCDVLLRSLDKAGFKHYRLKLEDGARAPVCELVYCDFSEDKESQEKARIFLHSLSGNIIKSNQDKCIIASQIDLLAVTHNIIPPCFGYDWSHKVDDVIKKLRVTEAFAKNAVPRISEIDVAKVETPKEAAKVSLVQYGMFAAGVVVGAAIVLASENARFLR